jgi:hypothetical protein
MMGEVTFLGPVRGEWLTPSRQKRRDKWCGAI